MTDLDDFTVTEADFDVVELSGGDAIRHDGGEDMPAEASAERWQSIQTALAEQPSDLPGLARLARALADRLEASGDDLELAAATHLADALAVSQ